MPTTSRLLLDINVWIALLDDAHVHNKAALALFQKPHLKIATCPPTASVAHDGVLATFDHRIALNAVVHAEKHHLVLL